MKKYFKLQILTSAIFLLFYSLGVSAEEIQSEDLPSKISNGNEKCNLNFSRAYWKLSLVEPTLGSFLGYELVEFENNRRRYRFLFVADKIGFKINSSVVVTIDEQSQVISLEKPAISIDKLNATKANSFLFTLQNEVMLNFEREITRKPYRFEILKGCRNE